MQPFALQAGDIQTADYEMFVTMRRIFEALPDLGNEPVVSCHMVTRAFARHFPVTVVDGHFGRGCHHSWLVLRDRTPDGLVIADLYPVAGASPILLFAHWITPWSKLYMPDPAVMNGLEDAAFTARVDELSLEIQKIMSNDVSASSQERVFLRSVISRVNDASWAPDVEALKIEDMPCGFLEDLREEFPDVSLDSIRVEHAEFPSDDANREEREVQFIISLVREEADALLAHEDADEGQFEVVSESEVPSREG
jgi:hypothetical protein